MWSTADTITHRGHLRLPLGKPKANWSTWEAYTATLPTVANLLINYMSRWLYTPQCPQSTQPAFRPLPNWVQTWCIFQYASSRISEERFCYWPDKCYSSLIGGKYSDNCWSDAVQLPVVPHRTKKKQLRCKRRKGERPFSATLRPYVLERMMIK